MNLLQFIQTVLTGIYIKIMAYTKEGQQPISKSADYTITVNDIRSGKVIVADTSSGDVTFTLPALSTLPSDGLIRTFAIGHNVGSNNVIIKTNTSDNFVYATVSKTIDLGHGFFHFTIGGMYNGTTGRWGLQSHTNLHASGHRDASWASSNFSSLTVVPLDSEAYNNNDELLIYTSGASARYTVKTAGRYKVSYFINIDSTGGSTWNVTSYIYKNGSSIETSEVRGGNYGNEDDSLTSVPFYVDLVADDYVDLRVDQNNLTGNLIHAVINIELDI